MCNVSVIQLPFAKIRLFCFPPKLISLIHLKIGKDNLSFKRCDSCDSYFREENNFEIIIIYIYILVYSSIVQVGEYLTVTTVTIVTT